MKTQKFVLSLALFCAPTLLFAAEGDPLPEAPKATAEKEAQLWFRNAGEYISTRSTRMGFPTDVNTKILTDGKRFDVSVGKRIPLYTWEEKSLSEAWVFGIDGGMLASLERFSRSGNLTFGTYTFDGFFGAFAGKAWDGWLALLRTAHLSAHLVDNSPQVTSAVSYSQFWNELIVAKTLPGPEKISDWDLHIQGSVGLNNTSTPKGKQPRASLGVGFGHTLDGTPDGLALLASADALRAGVEGQRPSYSFFAGIGTLNRPQSKSRPFRAGLAHFTGSDYRNQYYARKQRWTTFELSAEF
jgi:hypothetical protein